MSTLDRLDGKSHLTELEHKVDAGCRSHTLALDGSLKLLNEPFQVCDLLLELRALAPRSLFFVLTPRSLLFSFAAS